MEVAVRKVYAENLEQQQIEVRQSVMDGLKQAREGKTKDFNAVCDRLEIMCNEYHNKKYDNWYWKEICRIHDEARKIELEYASLQDAFLPLEAVAEEEIAWLYVLPEKMRHGIGRQLVTHALDAEKSIYYVEALFGNEPAKGLYESFGFTVKEILCGQMPGNERFQVKVYSMYRNGFLKQ